MVHSIKYIESCDRAIGKALFLDRDGVVNRKAPEGKYITNWQDFEFNEGIFQLVKEANHRDFMVIGITNQRCIAKGLLSHDDFKELSGLMLSEFRNQGGDVQAIYYCPHNKGECECRKPSPGMLLAAREDFNLNLAKSVLIGDRAGDMQAAIAAGIGKYFQIPENDLSVLDYDDIFSIKQ